MFRKNDICKKYFIKFAGAKTINDHDLPPEDAIDRLKAARIKYKDTAQTDPAGAVSGTDRISHGNRTNIHGC